MLQGLLKTAQSCYTVTTLQKWQAAMTVLSHAAEMTASHLLRCGNSQDIHQLAGGVQVLLHGWICQGVLQAPGSLCSRRALLCSQLLVSGSQWSCKVRALCWLLSYTILPRHCCWRLAHQIRGQPESGQCAQLQSCGTQTDASWLRTSLPPADPDLHIRPPPLPAPSRAACILLVLLCAPEVLILQVERLSVPAC